MSSESDAVLRFVKLTQKIMTPKSEAVLRFVILTEKALTPTKESYKATGFDLRSTYCAIVPARGKELIKTDLQIQLPEVCYGSIAPRSGLELQHHINVGAGVIDEDYRGNLGVILFSHSGKPFVISRSDVMHNLFVRKFIILN
jgi:dUTP pyrophosphatase